MKLHCKVICILVFILLYQSKLLCEQDTLSYPPSSSRIIPALNFKDTDIRDVLRSVAYEYQTNIVIDNQVSQKISTTLFNIKVFDALKIIAQDNNLEFSFDSQRFFVKTKKEKVVPPPPPPAEPEPEVIFSKNKLNISVNNTDIQKVVGKLREATKRNYLVTSGTTGRISGTLVNIDLETGLKNILHNNGFYLTVKDSIYYISRSAYYSSLESNSSTQQNGNAYWVSARQNKVTLDVNQVSLDRVVSDLSNQLGLQMIKLAVPNVNVTVKCSDVALEKAFEFLFKGTEFSFKKDGALYVIGNKSSKNLDNTKLLRLKYLRADKTKEMLPQNMLQSVTMSVSIEHNALIVTGPNESVSNFEDYIETIDRPVPQVLIEALVVDYNLTNKFQFGISAGRGDSTVFKRPSQFYPGIDAHISGYRINKILNDAGSINLFGKDVNVAKLGKLPDDFYMSIKAMEDRGIANVKSKPILSSLNGHTASLKIGTVQNYVLNDIMPVTNQLSSTFLERERVEKIEANISFEITPWIGPNDELTLEIKPEFQTPIGDFVPDKRKIPAINTRSFSSTVRLRDGETIVLGGLIQETESNTEDKFPVLGDIPLLGYFFKNVIKSKGKNELVVYLTPKIQYGDDFGSIYYNYAN